MTSFDYEKMKPILIEYFVRIRGENNRDAITKRINQSELVFTYNSDDLVSKVNQVTKRKKLELTIKFLELNGFIISDDIKKRALSNLYISVLGEVPGANRIIETFFDTNGYDNVSFHLFRKYFMEVREEDEDFIRNRVILLNKMGANVSIENYYSFIDSKEAIPFLIQIEKQKRIITVLDKEFEEFSNEESFVRDKKKLESDSKEKNKIFEKNLLLFILSIKDFLSENDRKKIDEFVNSNSKNEYAFWNLLYSLESYNIYFDSNLSNPSCIEAFSSEAIAILNDPESSNISKNDIKYSQMSYFKRKGLYDGSIPFEDFLKSEIAISNMPEASVADSISESRKKYVGIAKEEYFMATSSYLENLRQLQSMGLSVDPEFKPDFITNGKDFITPCQRVVNGSNDICSIIYFRSMNAFSNSRDIDFIHEISHVIETCLINIDGNIAYKSGFEMIPTTGDNHDEREFENFNEVINQLFAMEVAEDMHEDGLYLFDDPRFSYVRGSTSYEHRIKLINDFFEKYKEFISNSRISNKFSELYKKIGENNFIKLNNIVNMYSSLPIGKEFCKSDEESSELGVKKQELETEFSTVLDGIQENNELVTK